MKALSFGEVLWDVYADKQVIGGAPFNFAAHFVKCGGEAFMLSAVGRDALAEDTLKEIALKGVDARFVQRNDLPTGRCMVSLNEDGIPSYNLLSNTAYDKIDLDDTLNKTFDLLYFGTLSLRGEHNLKQLKLLLQKGSFKEIFVDLNLRPPFSTEEAVRLGVSSATLLKISDEELDEVCKILFGEVLAPRAAARRLAQSFKNLKIVVITLGERGSFALDTASGKEFSAEGKKVVALSTVGAGDSFSAAFSLGYLKGDTIPEALELATKVSAFVVTKTEAIPEYIKDEL